MYRIQPKNALGENLLVLTRWLLKNKIIDGLAMKLKRRSLQLMDFQQEYLELYVKIQFLMKKKKKNSAVLEWNLITVPTSQMNGDVLLIIGEVEKTIPQALDP